MNVEWSHHFRAKMPKFYKTMQTCLVGWRNRQISFKSRVFGLYCMRVHYFFTLITKQTNLRFIVEWYLQFIAPFKLQSKINVRKGRFTPQKDFWFDLEGKENDRDKKVCLKADEKSYDQWKTKLENSFKMKEIINFSDDESSSDDSEKGGRKV